VDRIARFGLQVQGSGCSNQEPGDNGTHGSAGDAVLPGLAGEVRSAGHPLCAIWPLSEDAAIRRRCRDLVLVLAPRPAVDSLRAGAPNQARRTGPRSRESGTRLPGEKRGTRRIGPGRIPTSGSCRRGPRGAAPTPGYTVNAVRENRHRLLLGLGVEICSSAMRDES